jgi:hypothetical protein
MSSVDTDNRIIQTIEKIDGHNHKINRFDSSELLLSRLLQKMDSQERKLDSIIGLLKGIAARL